MPECQLILSQGKYFFFCSKTIDKKNNTILGWNFFSNEPHILKLYKHVAWLFSCLSFFDFFGTFRWASFHFHFGAIRINLRCLKRNINITVFFKRIMLYGRLCFDVAFLSLKSDLWFMLIWIRRKFQLLFWIKSQGIR